MTQQGKGRGLGEVEAAPSLLLGAGSGMGGEEAGLLFQYEPRLTGTEGSAEAEQGRLRLGGMQPLPA